MVAQLGFANEAMGGAPVAWEEPNGNSLMTPRAASEETEREIDLQVKALVKSAYETTYKTLSENREFLDGLCEKLIEQETVDYDELQRMRESYRSKLIGPSPNAVTPAKIPVVMALNSLPAEGYVTHEIDD